mgnify:CR=1 FL=1
MPVTSIEGSTKRTSAINAFSRCSRNSDGGFYRSESRSTVKNGSTLIVFYTSDLELTLSKVVTAGGEISRDIFPFPGGRRFHFNDPHGNELAVWSE